jgi:hypothetical protein
MTMHFDPEGAGADAAVFGLLVGNSVAAVTALNLRKATKATCLLVFCLGFFVPTLSVFDAVRRWAYHKYQAPYDRFSDSFISPIPASVAKVRFVPQEESIRSGLFLQFDIAPDDLDVILSKFNLQRVDGDKFLNPDDFLRHWYYLPIPGEYEIFQGKDGRQNIVTIKTNKTHSHAIVRKEEAGYYKLPEPGKRDPWTEKQEHDDLERLRKLATR